MSTQVQPWVQPRLVLLAASADAAKKVSGAGNIVFPYASGFPAGYS